jgi:hypothetical protein
MEVSFRMHRKNHLHQTAHRRKNGAHFLPYFCFLSTLFPKFICFHRVILQKCSRWQFYRDIKTHDTSVHSFKLHLRCGERICRDLACRCSNQDAGNNYHPSQLSKEERWASRVPALVSCDGSFHPMGRSVWLQVWSDEVYKGVPLNYGHEDQRNCDEIPCGSHPLLIHIHPLLVRNLSKGTGESKTGKQKETHHGDVVEST